MTAGFQVIGDHGSVQIDENYYNMALMAKGTITSTNQQIEPYDGSYTPMAYVASITITGNSPVICIDTKGIPVSIYNIIVNGNQFTFNILTFNASNQQTAPQTFAYYIYDQMPNLPATNQGLTVWNASGQVCFNSDYEPMRIINTAQVPDSWTIISNVGTPTQYYPPASTTLYSSGAAQKIAVGITTPKIYGIVANSRTIYKAYQTFLTDNSATTPYATTEGGGQDGSGSATPYCQWGPSISNPTSPYGGLMFIVDISNYAL